MKKNGMFFHLLARSLRLRRRRSLSAFLALSVGAGVVTALLGLYQGIDAQLNREFRGFGANIIVTAGQGSLAPDATRQATGLLGQDALAVSSSYAIATAQNGNAVVVVGTDLPQQRRLNPWWAVSNWPTGSGEALVGEQALRSLALHVGDSFALAFNGASMPLKVAGTLRTGGSEDSRIYVSQGDYAQLAGDTAIQLIEISVPGTNRAVQEAVDVLGRALPQAEIHPVRKLIDAQAGVIGRTRSLMWGTTALIAITVGLCVLTTLSSSIVERRKDFAIMKALGSSDRTLNLLFGFETGILGIFGGATGFLLGCCVAAAIARIDFGATIWPQPSMLAIVVPATCLVALTAALLPLLRLRAIQPASMLKGE